jgi:hypothetical protein
MPFTATVVQVVPPEHVPQGPQDIEQQLPSPAQVLVPEQSALDVHVFLQVEPPHL